MSLARYIGALAMLVSMSSAYADGSQSPGEGAETTSAERAKEINGLTSNEWTEPRVPADLLWHLFALPERVVEFSFAPLSAVVTAVERFRLDKRAKDVFVSEDGRFIVLPKVKFGNLDGIGFGAGIVMKRLWGTDGQFDSSGVYRLDGDYRAKARYKQSSPRLEGRVFEVEVAYERDANQRWYGIGNDTASDDRRVLASERFDGDFSIDLRALGTLRTSGKLRASFISERTSPGTTGSRTPVGEEGDNVVPPPGFGERLNFPRLAFEFRFDSRDRKGRPTKGTVIQAHAALTSDVDGADLNAASFRLSVNQYLTVLPLFRTLALRAGLGVAEPLTKDGQVPHRELVTMGRDNFLRGYDRLRFVDKYGWWTGAQYNFPVGEYTNTRIALNVVLFGDLGRVSEKPSKAFDGRIRYSYGGGINIAHTSRTGVSVLLGSSPEGLQFSFSAGLEL